MLRSLASSGTNDHSSFLLVRHRLAHRVVKTLFGQHAQFKVRVQSCGSSRTKWLRYSEFKRFAETAAISTPARAAWKTLTENMPGYRCLDTTYLGRKCHLLEKVRRGLPCAGT